MKEGLTKLQWSNIQIEEGTVATQYEPYVEDKLTILSPVQLEKVGDVADRLIEKDGVWGVEKNIGTSIVDENRNWTASALTEGDNTKAFQFTFAESAYGVIHTKNKISDKFPSVLHDGSVLNSDIEYISGVSSTSSNTAIRINKSRLETVDVDGFKKWISENPVLVKFHLLTPTFIPLPHDQQVKLRTFANKTNISFLTEIEGTIKAQVPKSLGATVNTHTEQIRSLNNELNRVKKLEESTVSTVTTESDFTTVKATSNGYFEDVKLEGKTLVNLAPKYSIKWTHSGTWLSKFLIGAKNPSNHYYKIIQDLKPNTEYTVIVNIKTNTQSGNIDLNNYQNNNTCVFKDNMLVKPSDIGIKTFKVKTVESFDNINPSDMVILRSQNWGIASGETLIEDIMILEGDHTQNPPSYFEGLKSVGDGADEIVVSSVKGDGNLIDLNNAHSKICTISNDSIIGTNEYNDVQFYVYLEKGMQYFFNSNGSRDIKGNIMYGMQKSYNASATLQVLKDLKTKPFTFIGDTGLYTLHVPNFRGIVKDIQLVKGDTPKPYIPHQSDKKRLLYYNTETQAWEEPILRQWDSIEKHANGKYYYHQRSGKAVLNGSESWTNQIGQSAENTLLFTIPNNIFKYGDLPICDLFNPSLVDLWQSSKDYEGLFLTSNGFIQIRINKSKLPTQDLQGFKQWLQANNATVVYQLAQEKVYECTNIDLITYANETNYVVESGVLSPKTTLKVHSNISNVVSLLQKKVSLLESDVKASQEVQDMMILETDMRMLDVELALMEFIPMTLNLGGSNMLRSATYFNFLKNHIINETYEKEYLENVMNKYLATGRINQDEYNELYKMLYPPVYDIELPIEY